MIIVSVLFLLLCFVSVRLKNSLLNNELYIEGYSISNTTALRGILALGIVICHMTVRVDYHIPFI